MSLAKTRSFGNQFEGASSTGALRVMNLKGTRCQERFAVTNRVGARPRTRPSPPALADLRQLALHNYRTKDPKRKCSDMDAQVA